MATLTAYEVAQAIVACVYEAVDHDDDLSIERVGVVPGAEIAWDNCECGQLVIAQQRRFPSLRFPTEEIDFQAECGDPWLVVDYTLSLARCTPTTNEDQSSPAIVDLEAAAAQQSTDADAARNAIVCCLDALFNTHQVAAYQVMGVTMPGPGGLCQAIEITILVGWLNGCGC